VLLMRVSFGLGQQLLTLYLSSLFDMSTLVDNLKPEFKLPL
jgi:hypothetical protein